MTQMKFKLRLAIIKAAILGRPFIFLTTKDHDPVHVDIIGCNYNREEIYDLFIEIGERTKANQVANQAKKLIYS
jgi:hypothetical protein